MSRRTVAGLALVTALAACRTLVGIDDLSAPPQGPDGGNGQGNQGQADGGNGDAQATIQGCLGTDQCRACCKQGFKGLVQAIEHGDRGAACICQQSTCQAACTSNGKCDPATADTQGSTGQGANPCVACEDDLLSGKGQPLTGPCSDICNGDSDCAAGILCLQSCH